MLFSWRLLTLFLHVTAVIVALGGSLFSTFALTPILARELDLDARIRVMRRVIRRLGAIVLTALAVLVATGMLNIAFLGEIPVLLMVKLALVCAVIVLALYQYGIIGARIWRLSANGPDPLVGPLQMRFRKLGLTVGAIVLIIVYLSLGLTRSGANPITLPVID